MDTMFDPTVTHDDLARIRQQRPGKVVVQGVQSVVDAVRCAEVGDDVEVHLDTGIISEQDLVVAIARGATFTFVGRACLNGPVVSGRAGVNRTMPLLGVTSLDELSPEHVTQLVQLEPRRR